MLTNKLNDRKAVSEHQINVIREKEIRVDHLLKDTEEQKNFFLEREMLNKIKYDQLERKYAALQKKVFDYKMSEDIRRVESFQITKKASKRNASKDTVEA